MWSEADRVQIRNALGFSSIFKQADLRLETAVTTVQSVADGGSRPDSSTENFIRQILYGGANASGVNLPGITQLQAQLAQLWAQASVMQASLSVKVDAARGMIMLRQEGRRLVNMIANQLDTTPRQDIFSSATPNPDGGGYGTSYYGEIDGSSY